MRSTLQPFIRTVLAAVLLTFSGNVQAATDHRLPNAKDRWIQVRTANFTIYSNGSERTTRLAGSNLEELRAVLRSLFGGMTFTSPVPTYIFVFDHPKSFSPYSLLYQGREKELGGYFNPGRFANHVAIVANRYGSDVSSTIYHEYVHYVLSTNQAELPLWLNEGLAEFYSTFELNGDLARIGYPIGNHLMWLKNNPIIPLAEFLAIDHDSPDYNEGDRRGVFYAQSWALTHMLIMGSPDGRNRATVYANLLKQGIAQQEAFEQALGGTYKEIEKELNRYVRARRFSYSEIPVDAASSGGSTVSEVSYPEILTRLGNLLIAQGPDRAPFAKEHFDAALAIDGSYGPAVAGLGRLDEAAGRVDDALARYERAAELAPDDFMVSFLLGRALFERHATTPTARDVEPLTRRTRAALRRAAVQQPSFAEAWALLGTTYTWDTEPEDIGIQAMETASRLLPKRGDLGYNLVLLQLRRDRIEEARATIRRMRAAGIDELMIEGAAGMIEDREQWLARVELRRQGTGEPSGNDAAAAGELHPSPGAAERRTFTEKYNEAVSLINAGDTERAIILLDTLVRESTTEEYASSAQALLDQTRSFLAFQAAAEEAQRLANSGRIEAAIDVLEPLVEDAASDQVHAAQVRGFLDKLYSYRDFQDRYNRAVDLVNAGDFDSAALILEPLVADAPTPQLSAMADRLLTELDTMR